MVNMKPNLCACGCNEQVSKPGNKYIFGHHWLGKNHSKQTKQKQREARLGKPNGFLGKKHTNETKLKMSKIKIGKSSNMLGKKHSKKTRELQSQKRVKYLQNTPDKIIFKKCNNSWFYSEKNNKKLWHRSSWELKYYKELEVNTRAIKYITEPFAIPYMFEGIKHNYLPDILVTYKDGSKELIEIKPSGKIDKQVKAKFRAAKKYCKQNDLTWTILTEKELEIN